VEVEHHKLILSAPQIRLPESYATLVVAEGRTFQLQDECSTDWITFCQDLLSQFTKKLAFHVDFISRLMGFK